MEFKKTSFSHILSSFVLMTGKKYCTVINTKLLEMCEKGLLKVH